MYAVPNVLPRRNASVIALKKTVKSAMKMERALKGQRGIEQHGGVG